MNEKRLTAVTNTEHLAFSLAHYRCHLINFNEVSITIPILEIIILMIPFMLRVIK